MSDIILVQGSLSKKSKTSIVINETANQLKSKNVDHEILDLRDMDMQFCDGRPLDKYNQDVQNAYKKMESAKAYVFGMPVYCWSVSGPLKNFIDLTAGAMEEKLAGLICNAGSSRSFLASADMIKILFYESNVVTVQPTVATSGEDFENGVLKNEKVHKKVGLMIDSLLKHMKK